MLRQYLKIFPNIEQKSQTQQSPAPQASRQQRRSSLGNKIGLGYALSLGIAILGTTAGLSIGNYQYQQAQQQAIDIDEETRGIGDFQENLAHIKIHTLQIISLKPDSAKFPEQCAIFGEHIRELKLVWEEIKDSSSTTELKELKSFLTTHEKTIDAYLQRLETLVESLESPVETSTVQQLILDFAREDLSLEMQELLEEIEPIQDIGDAIEDRSRDRLAEAEKLSVAIIVASMAISSAIAFFLALYTSRAIVRPLETLTAAARQVTQDANFDIQAPVTTSDEVGILATSFNQLIQQVKHLLDEQKAAGERQLLQNEKLASLGQMLAGVAHELNNPLGCIYGNLDYANNYFENLLSLIQTYQSEIPLAPEAVAERAEEIEFDYIKEDLPKMLQAMQLAAERAKAITQSLKNFSRLDEASPHPVDLHACLDSTLLILHNRIKNRVAVIRNYGNLPAIEGYSGMLSQVFMNVLSNAIEALEERWSKNGKVESSEPSLENTDKLSANLLLTEEPAGNFHASPRIIISTERLDESYIVVRIYDNGPGIPSEIQAKIFDTFFTTKSLGVGTGLGLAISRQIVVEKHGGRLTCSSQVGMGTEFAIALPVKQAVAAASPALSKSDRPSFSSNLF